MHTKVFEHALENTRDELISYLLKEYYHKVYVYCFQILRNAHDAEDAVQEVFIKAFQYKKLLNIENYSAWLHKIAYHYCLNKAKRQSLIKFISFEGRVNVQDLDYFYNPDIDLELDEIMSKLKAKERALLALRIIEDRDFAEVVLILNITPATARKRFERVKAKVQKIIERNNQNEK
ncbi:sigma-70 family RNA polymerase sigma factor [Lysinibacillus sp. FSL K6-0057]|uniref:RNA polymerase sigma factor n=1 Tax=unclassified Lysinibacillus TaxID=2636778 RepID=UPI003157F67F